AVELAPIVGIALACAALGVTRATYYRAQLTPFQPKALERRRSEWALNEAEQQDILALLHAPAYADKSPRTVYALLLDAGRYLASVSTFYRLMRGAVGKMQRTASASRLLGRLKASTASRRT